MQTKEFWGRDINEALQAVRASLGDEALILETSNMPGEEGTDKEERVKIVAMPGEGDARQPVSDAPRRSTSRSTPVRAEPKVEGGRDLSQQLSELRSLLCWLAPSIRKGSVVDELLAQGVSPQLLTFLVQQAENDDGHAEGDEREKMRRVLTRLIRTGGALELREAQRSCLALIGPPGVGKTTTVVKLTVRLTRQDNRQVGWVSLANQGIAGAELLAVYAGILGVPCEMVETKEELLRAIERLSHCDLVFIDAAGVSSRDAQGLRELAIFLQDIPELRRLLVLSATTNGPDMYRWVEQYERVGFDALLFTMVDECAHFGPLLSTLLQCDRPLSYLANGQKVTRDLEVAFPEAVARLVLP
jgi:flagellar biosynthesis protein FlhF